jgi:hypothetical protein
MKTILIIVGLLFHYVSASAQKQELTYINYDRYNDSLETWKFQTKSISSKSYAYDGKLLKESQGNGINGAKGQESNCEYDSKGRKIKKERKFIGYGGDKTEFNFKVSEEWTYNNSDSISDYSFSRYDFSLNRYTQEFGARYEYNSQNLRSTAIYSSSKNPQMDEFEQIDYAKVQYSYNDKKQLIREEYLDLYTQNQSKTEYVYNQNGYKTQEIYSYYVSNLNLLTESGKKKYEYDAQGNITSILISGRDINISSLFVPSTKQTFAYDKDKREVLNIVFYFQPQLNLFKEVESTKSDHNENGLLVMKKKKYLVRGIDLDFFEKDTSYQTNTYQYYPDKKLKEEIIFYQYNNSTSGDRARYEYQIAENTIEIGFADSYVVYPNPATDKITVENTLDDECLESVALHDMSGKQILSLKRIEAPLCRWEVELPLTLNSGLYLVSFKSYNGKTTGKKLFIQR